MLLRLRDNLIILVDLFTKFILHVNEGCLPEKSDKYFLLCIISLSNEEKVQSFESNTYFNGYMEVQ